MPRIALNGLGRIGKLVLRDLIDTGAGGDIVLLNAAAAIVAGQKAKDFKEGIAVAAHSIDSGAASEKLERLVAMTNKPS